MDRADTRRKADGLTVTRSPTLDPRLQHRTGDDRAGALKRERTIDREGGSALRGARTDFGRLQRNRCSRSSSIPSPLTTDTGTISAPVKSRIRGTFAISVRPAFAVSADARSALVSATMPRLIPSRSTIARCSRVCGMTRRPRRQPAARSRCGRTGQHVVDEFLMPGTSTNRARSRPASEDTQIQGRSRCRAPFSFLQAIRVDAGQRTRERCLAVSIWPAVRRSRHGLQRFGRAAFGLGQLIRR